MKLNQKTPPVVAAGNPIYDAFGPLFLRVFGTDEQQQRPDDDEFYQHLYYRAPFSQDRQLLARAPVLKQLALSENEVDLLRFALRLIDARKIVLVGDVGWGKSTLLEYVFNYLKRTVPGALDGVGYVRLNFNAIENDFWRIVGERGDKREVFQFLRDQLVSRLKEVVEPCLPDGQALRDLVWGSPQFAAWRVDAKIADTLRYGAGLPEQAIGTFTSSDRYPEFLSWAWTRINNGPLIVVFDNVDQLPLCLHQAVATEGNSICERWTCLVILAVRSYTWAQICRETDHFRYLKVSFYAPNVSSIISKRVEYYGQPAKAPPELLKPTMPTADGRTLTHAESVQFVTTMVRDLSDARDELLAQLSNLNLRYALQYMRLYLSTGFARVGRVDGPLFTAEADLREVFPQHTFIRAVVSDGMSTYSSDRCSATTIANMWCSGQLRHQLNHFIRPYLLLLLSRYGNALRRSKIKEIFKQTFYFCPDTDDLVDRTVTDLIIRELVVSANLYKIPPRRAEDAGLGSLTISMAGQSYLNGLMFEFPYISMVKDDAEIDLSSAPTWLRSVTAANGLSEQLMATYSFVEYLFTQESVILDRILENRGSTLLYSRYFVMDGHSMFLSLELARELKRIATIGYRTIIDYVPTTRPINLVGNLLEKIQAANSRVRAKVTIR